MTTLKELFMSRACKVGLAALLAVSMVPAAALSTAPAFAEDAEVEQVANDAAIDERVVEAADSADEATADDTAEAAEAAPARDAAQPAGDEGTGQPMGEPIEGSAAEGTDEEVAPAPEEGEEELIVSDFQLETLETTVQEPFSFWGPFRLLFGADDSFTVPLKSGNYTNWIDRLDLSGAVDAHGTNYARNFYNILVEGADNDGTRDVLIDNTSYSPAAATVLATSSPASRATVGNIYRVNSTAALLVAVLDDPNISADGPLTDVEQHARKYVNETYGAFDRDYPSSFWRDVNFGTMFVRDMQAKQTMCFFAMKGDSFDLRANGYRSQKNIRDAISALDTKAKAISDAFEATDANKASEYERVKFYNQWLCDNNSYNSRYAGMTSAQLQAFQNQNPDVWSAVSAISGRTGETGPVCEGYSRAMQLLCQKAGIGCVVVDGNTTAGAHMWNYVRIGSGWYALDITWNDTGSNNEQYLLVGSSSGFLSSHPVSNQFVAAGTKFTNGPVLSTNTYDPRNVAFAGAITNADTFPYGDSVKLEYNSTTPGTVTYSLTDGSDIASIVTASTPAESEANGGTDVLKITGVGTITVRATLVPTEGGTNLTDTITITAVPRPLQVTGTELAPKVYDGTVAATVLTAGQLVGALSGDSAKLGVDAVSARYNEVKAGEDVTGIATYKLTGDADTLKLYTLGGSGVGTDTSATGTITKRPVNAYFTLSSTRVLTTEGLPTGTVRFESATGNRGKLADDNLTPATLNIQTSGMPATMPTLAAGAQQTYDVTCTSTASSVITQIATVPTAANYEVSFSADTVVLTIVNLENTTVLDATSPTGSTLYRVEARVDGINDDTVTKLTASDSGFTTTESIISELLSNLRSQTTKALDDDRVTVYDMTLFVQDENGDWQPATVDNFPTDGVRVTIDYPESTAADTHSFYAAHMFTAEVASGGTVHKPGEVEKPQVMNGTDGVNFVLMGFSPVSVAWEDVPRQAASDDNGGLGSGITSQVGQQNAQQSGASGVSQTGDSLPVLTITVVALACIVLLVALVVRRNRSKKDDEN